LNHNRFSRFNFFSDGHLGGLAEFERELIRARTGEGRERAKAKGVKMGRKPKLTDHQTREAIKRRDHGEETLAEIGRSYNVSGWTIFEMYSNNHGSRIQRLCAATARSRSTSASSRRIASSRSIASASPPNTATTCASSAN
jgi:DNA invertase Pin-like site-specific DNA recombinase